MSNVTTANPGIGTRIAASIKKFVGFCKKNPGFTIGFIIMVIMLFVALFAEQLCPHDPLVGSPKD